jgi:hypothetical protein
MKYKNFIDKIAFLSLNILNIQCDNPPKLSDEERTALKNMDPDKIYELINSKQQIPNDEWNSLTEEQKQLRYDLYIQKEKNEIEYYKWGKNHFKLLEIVLKAFASSLMSSIFTELLDLGKGNLSFFQNINRMQEDTLPILKNYESVNTLYLTETQTEIENYLYSNFADFIKTNSNKVTETIVVLGGVSGTGKSALMYRLAYKLYKLELQVRPINKFKKFFNWLLPNFLKGMFKIHMTENGLYFILSGSYFYNYGNEQEKAAAYLEKILRYFLEHIINKNKNYFFVMIDEGELLLEEPFARVLKIITTELSMLNKNKKNGVGLIILSTNFIEKCSEALSRRLLVLEFDMPTANTKLKTFLLYLDKHMNINNIPEYSLVISSTINIWLKFCEGFSHSDMENLVWLLKLKYTTTNNLVCLLDLLKIIYIEWKKREIIVNKNKNAKAQDLEKLIENIEEKEEEFFSLLTDNVQFENNNGIIEVAA